MDDITPEKIGKVFPTLPLEIQELLQAGERQDKTAIIGKKYGLNRVETGMLSQVVTAVLVGLLKPNLFVPAIVDFLGTSRETAVLIAQDINRDIFNSVKAALTEVHSGVMRPVAATPIGLVRTQEPMSAVVPPPPPVVATPAAPAGSIFEQKLGGAFRMSAPMPEASRTREPMLIVPPPPPPTASVAPTGSAMAVPSPDSYREAI